MQHVVSPPAAPDQQHRPTLGMPATSGGKTQQGTGEGNGSSCNRPPRSTHSQAGQADGWRAPCTDESRHSRQSRHGSYAPGSSSAAFSFGGQRLGLRTRSLLDHSPGASHPTPCFPFPAQTAAVAASPVPYETPVLFGMRALKPQHAANPPPPCFSLTSTSTTSAPSGCQSVWADHMLVANILQWLEPLELHQVTQLGATCRAAHAALPRIPITDLDFSWRGRTYAEGEESADAIQAALVSLSGVQRQSVQRLVTSPDLLACPTSCLHMLAECPALAFLILTLQGTANDMFAAVADHWPQLERLTCRLPDLVCLDASACLMQDAHLQAVADHCPCLRALDLSYNPLLTSQGVALLLAACPQLEELDLSTCPHAQGPQVLEAVGRHCPQLTTLYLEHDPAGAGNSRAFTAGLSQENTFSTAHLHCLLGCKNLQLLSLAGQQEAAGCAHDTAAGGPNPFQQLLVCCTQLHTLNLGRCSCLSGADVHALATTPHALHQLQLSGGQQLSEDLMLQVAAGGAACLRVLHLDDAHQLTEQGLARLVQVCTALEELSLSGASAVSSAAACQVLSSRPALSLLMDGQQVVPGAGEEPETPPANSSSHSRKELRDCTNIQGGRAGEGGARSKEGQEGAGGATPGGKPAPPPWAGLLSFLSQQVDNIQL